MLLNTDTFKSFKGVKPASMLAIRNELANDGLVYVNNVKPIFTETIGNSISFFDTWFDQYNTIEDFHSNIELISRKIRSLTKNFETNHLIHE